MTTPRANDSPRQTEEEAARQLAAESVLRGMHERSIEELIHPQAEMRLLVSYGELVEGREGIAAALRHGREAGTFYVRVEHFEWLDA